MRPGIWSRGASFMFNGVREREMFERDGLVLTSMSFGLPIMPPMHALLGPPTAAFMPLGVARLGWSAQGSPGILV
jgi:hypothetical protein